jgi:hypothetical protein
VSAPGGDDRERDERPGQRDWRELDRRKDRSTHRKEERPAGGKRSRAGKEAAHKEYVAGLHRLFDTGDAGGRVAKVLPPMPKADDAEAPGAGAARQVALKRIRAAETSSDVKDAVAAFRADWDLPEDADALTQVLLHPDEAIVAEALAILDRILPLRRPTRRETLRTRLRRLEDDEDLAAETRALAGRVRSKA